ncbi:MAG TPA: hypothetical protein VNA31_06815 [bacterium]|nr:hypothetical protein [bacterium]
MIRLLICGVAGVLVAAAVVWEPQGPMLIAGMSVSSAAQSDQRITVPAGGNFQDALNTARPGDVLELPAGATFVGNFVLPNKPGTDWITIRTTAYDRLPPPGERVSPSHVSLMPRVVSPNGLPVISTEARAHSFRFIGIEFTTTSRANPNLIRLETRGQTVIDQVPMDIVFDRCFIHGTPTGDIRRGIALNGARVTVTGSYLSDFHERGVDSQALAGWNGPGPFKIVNNYLEGAGENVIFGGSTPSIRNLVPSDIEIRGNHFSKPLAWRAGDPAYAGIHWSVKNLFELKNASRVLIDGNVFEYNWPDAQNGFAILFTVRGEGGNASWATIQDITFTNNIVRHVAAGVNILGWDDTGSSGQTRRVRIQNNLFDDIGGPIWGGGRLFQLLDGTADVVIDHNTAFQTENPIVAGVIVRSRVTHTGFVFTNNIAPNNQYGVSGDGTFGDAGLTLKTYFPGHVFARNVLVGGNSTKYPPDNFFPATLAQVGFVDLAGGNYHLARSSKYWHGGTDQRDIGADFTALKLAMARR